MNKHERINKLLVDFVLGELSQQNEAEVKTHLAECHQCSSELKRLEGLLECTGRIRELSADKQICESAKQAIFAAVEREEIKPALRPSIDPVSILSTIMKSRTIKFAAATVIIIVAVLALHNGSIDIVSPAFGVEDVLAATQREEWMHAKYETIDVNMDPNTVEKIKRYPETWISVNPRRAILKGADGSIAFSEDDLGKSTRYNPETNTITIKYKASISKEQPASIAEMLLNQISNLERQGAKVAYSDAVYEDCPVTIIDIDYSDESGAHLKMSMVVDPETLLPKNLTMRQVNPKGQSIAASGVFDYPESGPNDIYQAGAPPDAQVKIIDDRDPQFLEAIKPYRAARENLPQCVVVETEADERGAIRTICVVYNDSINERFERIETNVTSDSIPSDKSFESLLTWASDIRTDSIWAQLYDGEYIYRARRDYEDFWSIREKEYSPKRNHRSYNGGLADRGWPEYVMYKGKVIENNYSTENGLICIEKQNEPIYEGKKLRYPAEKTLYYIQPQRGYMCVRKEQFQHHLPPREDPVDVEDLDFAPDDIPAEPYSITEVVEFGQTDAGQWYPKQIQQWSRRWIDQGYGWETSEETKTITLYLETNPDFPDGIFDPNDLVPTGAKIRKEGEKTSFEKHFEQAIAIVDSREHWPEPRELVRRYWQARSAKDYDEMAILWPGSASWNRKHIENEKPVEYVFGETRKAGDKRVIVPYAAKSYYDEHGTYNLKMWLHNKKSSEGRHYITSGN